MNEELFKRAIEHYGEDHQIGIAQEECAELIQALSKFLRRKPNLNNIAEEIADVEITVAQLKIIFQNEELVEKYKTYKLSRLQRWLDAEAETETVFKLP